MKEALKLALEALEHWDNWSDHTPPETIKAITAIKAALAQPAQEPVGVFCEDDDIGYVRLIPHQQMKLKAWDKLYTAPQQRPWVGLTEAQFLEATRLAENGNYLVAFVRIQEWLKEKNT